MLMSIEVPQKPQPTRDVTLTVNPETPKKSNLSFVLLSLLALILVGSGGFILAKYLYTPKTEVPVSSQAPAAPPAQTQGPFSSATNTPSVPTTDEMVNWKKYINTKFGFSFEYPPTWIINEYKPNQYYIFDMELINVEKNLGFSTNSDPKMGFTITINKTPYDKDALQRTGDTNGGFSGITSEVITFLGFPANKSHTTFTDTNLGIGVTYIILNKVPGGWRFGYPNINFKGEHNIIYDQILSTFKFLDKTEVLKTYSHAQLVNISLVPLNIKYPESWKLSVSEYPNSSGFQLTLAKSSSKIMITQGAMGGGGCLFPGDANQDGPYTRYNAPTTIVSANGTTWVRATYITQKPSDPLRYAVCQCKGSVCGGITNAGGISYEVANSDTGLLPEMDDIIKSAMPQN